MATTVPPPMPYHYIVNTNTTGYCADAEIASWLGNWPTDCALETAQSALHTLFVLCVFQFALGMLSQRPAQTPAAAPDLRNTYYASDALRLGLSLAAVTMWLGSILYHGLAKLELPPYHTLLMVTSATAWICYLALSMELDVTQPQVAPSRLYRATKAAWLGGQLCLGLAIAVTSKIGALTLRPSGDGPSAAAAAAQISSASPSTAEAAALTAGSNDGPGEPPMAATATLLLQQFSLVVQLSINVATVCLELYGRAGIVGRGGAGEARSDRNGQRSRGSGSGLLHRPLLLDREAEGESGSGREGHGWMTAGSSQGGGRGGAVSSSSRQLQQPVAAEASTSDQPDSSSSAAELNGDGGGGGGGGGGAGGGQGVAGVTGVQQLALRLYFVCSGFGTRMMWYSLNVALPYFTQLYGPAMYPRMLLGYNLGAIVSLSGQVMGDAHFDALYGPVVTTCFRVNLGMGCMFLLMVYFPHTPNTPFIPVALSTAVGVLDYFATGSLTQMASRVGGIVPTFFFLGQALSGAFLFGFTTSVDWSVEEMAVDNVQHYKHNHQDVIVFFGYASSFVVIGLVAFNFLITSDVIKAVHRVPSHRPWYYHRKHNTHADDPAAAAAAAVVTAGCAESGSGSSGGGQQQQQQQQQQQGGWQQSLLAFRLTIHLQVGIVVLWISLLSVQSLFGLDKQLQEPLMFVNLFGLMAGMQLNVLFAKTLELIASPRGLLIMICAAMPTFSTLYTLQTLGVLAGPGSGSGYAYLVVGATAVFYVIGGSSWMLCYTLAVKILPTDELRTEATRLLNLMTQAGILAGVGIGMLLMDLAQHRAHGAGGGGGAGSTGGGGGGEEDGGGGGAVDAL